MTASSKVQRGSVIAVLLMSVCGWVYAAGQTESGDSQTVEVEDRSAMAHPLRNVSSGPDVGAATDALFAKQRASPAVRPRMIDGVQASRSYERYLKSFEYPIPEVFDTGTKTQN